MKTRKLVANDAISKMSYNSIDKSKNNKNFQYTTKKLKKHSNTKTDKNFNMEITKYGYKKAY